MKWLAVSREEFLVPSGRLCGLVGAGVAACLRNHLPSGRDKSRAGRVSNAVYIKCCLKARIGMLNEPMRIPSSWLVTPTAPCVHAEPRLSLNLICWLCAAQQLPSHSTSVDEEHPACFICFSSSHTQAAFGRDPRMRRSLMDQCSRRIWLHACGVLWRKA